MPTSHNNLRRSEAEERAALVSNVHYRVHLTLPQDTAHPDTATFRSHSTIEFDAAKAGTTFLDISAEGVTATLNGRPLPDSAYDAKKGRLRLDGLVAGRNSLEVTSSPAYSNDGEGMVRSLDEDGSVALYTNSEPYDAHRFVACFDQPDLKSTFDVSVTGPKDWTYVGNEAVKSDTVNADGSRTVAFHTTQPLAPYFLVVSAGDYVHIQDTYTSVDGRTISLDLYARKSLAKLLNEQAPEILQTTKDGLRYYESKFGAYPYSKYGQLFAPDFNVGAMENPGLVTINDALVLFRGPVTATRKRYRTDVILHEMAHHWYGDLVTMKWWNDLWLNESFATVMSLLAQTGIAGDSQPMVDFAISARHGKPAALRQDQLSTTHPIATAADDILTTVDNFDPITYEKGAAVIRQLVARVGEEAFFKGVRSYLQKHAWGNATFADLLTELSLASGRDLSTWAKEWIGTSGVNTLRADVDVDPRTGKYRSVAIVQEGRPPRQHTIKVGVYDLDSHRRLVRTETIEVDVSGTRTEIPQLKGRRRPALLLVNDEDLTYAKVRFDTRSLETVTKQLSAIEDPLARAVTWASLWDMTRDGELAPEQWLDLVATHGRREPLATVIDSLTSWSHLAALSAAPDVQPELRSRMASTARQMLRSAAPGSDLQTSWLRAFIANASSPTDMAALQRILDGKGGRDAPGLTVGLEARWGILARLAGAGAIDMLGIEREAARDGSDLAQRFAMTATAALPSARAKEWAWCRISDPKIGLADLRAVLAGFHRSGQAGLTKPYTDRLPKLLGGWWRDRGSMAGEMTDALLPVVDTSSFARNEWIFPSVDVGPEAAALADSAIAALPKRSPAVRHLVEGRDVAVRAMGMRAASERFQVARGRHGLGA